MPIAIEGLDVFRVVVDGLGEGLSCLPEPACLGESTAQRDERICPLRAVQLSKLFLVGGYRLVEGALAGVDVADVQSHTGPRRR